MEERKVNLNKASFEELKQVPGLGETRAHYIYDNRPYHSWDDVKRVPGFSDELIHTMQRGSTIK